MYVLSLTGIIHVYVTEINNVLVLNMKRFYCGIFLFILFTKKISLSAKKKFSLAIPGSIIFHIKSNYGI